MAKIKPGTFYTKKDNNQSTTIKKISPEKITISEDLSKIYTKLLKKLKFKPKITLYIGCGYDETAACKIPGKVINIDKEQYCINLFNQAGHAAICTNFDDFEQNNNSIDLIISLNSIKINQKMIDLLKYNKYIVYYHWNDSIIQKEKQVIKNAEKLGLIYKGKIEYVNVFQKK